MDGEFLAADVEGVECVGAVAPSAASWRLDGKDKVGVVGAVEE